MGDMNKRLEDWNATLAEGEALASKLRRDAMQSRGWMRRVRIALLRFTERWIKRGRRWRNDDIGER